ncbi:TPA: N-glycosylase/DNA lyase [Candidatus Woesearchaeota archaeon]|nr:N-glycosylase/DNA lyase [Candidatus Woesearchaeota archaeon]HIH39883.1 N-glycosylase/DNA lyase [Candidatus Woesearchaeota archaeon]
MNLLKDVKNLQKSDINKVVNKRLSEFSSFKNKSDKEWFSELCFCLLTANSKAKTAIAIQKELGHEGFRYKSWKELAECIRRNKHRFHNNKAKFIVGARKYSNIKNIIKNIVKSGINSSEQSEAREFLVKNIKGLGYKEASHFLRNVGYFDLAILDRHILNLMVENKLIKEKPKSLTNKTYFEIENKFRVLADKLEMSLAELDLYMWYMKTGEILK